MTYAPNERIRTIKLYDGAEAVRALGILVPGFDRFMAQAKDNGLVFSIFHGKRNLGQDEQRDPPGRLEIRIALMI